MTTLADIENKILSIGLVPRRKPWSPHMFVEWKKMEPGDYVVVPLQFILKYKREHRTAREMVRNKNASSKDIIEFRSATLENRDMIVYRLQ